jgi:hypothetical protein
MTETRRPTSPTVALQTLQVEPVALQTVQVAPAALQTQPPQIPLQTVPGGPAALQTVDAVALQTAPDSVSASGAQYEPRAQREGDLAPLVS